MVVIFTTPKFECNLIKTGFTTLVTFSNVLYYVVDILDVVDSVTELFETKYERGLRRADRAISEQMDLVHVSFGRKRVMNHT